MTEKRPRRHAPGAAWPTMADVATLAGVSIATVSRAVTGTGFISARNKLLVTDAVRRTGYVVNEAARGLRLQRTGHVLVLVPRINKPFYASVLLGVEEALQEGGLRMLVGNAGLEGEREAALATTLLTGGTDGLIILTGRMPHNLIGAARAERRLVAGSEPIAGLASVTVDNEAAIGAATAHLIGLGHHRIAHIGGLPDAWLSRARLAGFEAAMLRAGLPVLRGFVRFDDFTMRAGEAAARRLLALKRRPTALVCASDEIAIGAMKAVWDAGLSVPGDVSIVGFDDIEVAYALRPALTTVQQPRHLMGRVAAQMLLSLLEGHGAVADHVLPTELIVRDSTGPAPAI